MSKAVFDSLARAVSLPLKMTFRQPILTALQTSSGAGFSWTTSGVGSPKRIRPAFHQFAFGISTLNWVATTNMAVASNCIEKEVEEETKRS